MKNVLFHGEVNQKMVAQTAAQLSGDLIVLEAEFEEKEWTVPADQAGRVQTLFSNHPPQNLADMTALKFWQIGSVGFTQLTHLDLPGRGIRVCNARGVFDSPIGEWNVAMMINLARDLRGMIHNQSRGHWDPDARFQQEVRGSTVGIWGYGGIGRETARLCKALGMTVYVLSRAGVQPRTQTFAVPGTGDPQGVLPDKVFLTDQRFEFLQDLDFLVVAMPLTPTTKGIIGAAELAALPRHAYLLNPARGPIIDEQALLDALDENQIAGAALDTHYHYPMPADHLLWRYPQVIMTPHISGSSANRQFAGRIWTIFGENLRRLETGEPLLNELTAPELRGET